MAINEDKPVVSDALITTVENAVVAIECALEEGHRLTHDQDFKLRRASYALQQRLRPMPS